MPSISVGLGDLVNIIVDDVFAADTRNYNGEKRKH